MLEILFVIGLLASIALWMAASTIQSKKSLKSSSTINECQSIVKNTLDHFISLGSRLYGYKNKHSTANLAYDPLFIAKNTKGYDTDDNIKDVGDGQTLAFPPNLYQELFKDLVGMDISTPVKTNPKTNMGFALVSDKNTYPIEIGTSVLLVNFVNALQYLYNSDSEYSTGDGKQITGTDGFVASLLKDYKNKKSVKQVQFYVKITPVKTDGTVVNTRPILTRPRFPAHSNTIPLDLRINGEVDIGFEVKVKLAYQQNSQDFSCDGSRQLFHQRFSEVAVSTETLDVTLKALSNGAGQDLLANQGLNNTSCDRHGNGYEDISLTLDFDAMTESRYAGTVILCQMNSYCQTDGNDTGYTNSTAGINCTPEKGQWQRCHDIQPKASSDQSWSFKSKLAQVNSKDVLKLQFDNMKANRRYDLHIGEFAIDGKKLRSQKFVFYIDGTRPFLVFKEFLGDEVGTPDDGIKSRNYQGPKTNWQIPSGAFANKWIQCNQNDVSFKATINDQFTHNLKNCEITWKRQDGQSTTLPATITSTFDKDQRTCEGTLTGIQHGRQTIEMTMKDACGGASNKEQLVWDTDLPSTFEIKGFVDTDDHGLDDGEIWLKSKQTGFPIKTKLPSKTIAGAFPKHYSLDCQDNYIGHKIRDDGDSGSLTCNLSTIKTSDDDGANPNDFDARFYHVCGTNQCESSKWAVYPPLKGSCANVRCEAGHICCNDPKGDCGGGAYQQCQEDKWTHSCSNPACSHKSGDKGCPPYGLYDCTYKFPCVTSKNEKLYDCSCVGKKSQSCDITKDYYCESTDALPDKLEKNAACPNSEGYCDVNQYYNYPSSGCTATLGEKCLITIPRQKRKFFNYDRYRTDMFCPLYCGPSSHLHPPNNLPGSTGPCETVYPQDSTITFQGTCSKPEGSCSPRSIGGGQKSKEKASQRTAC